MKQVTLPLNLAHRRTRKREFLESMERAVPWPALLALIAHFKGTQVLTRPKPGVREIAGATLDLADIKGQESAKRALEVAAAGGHNLLMIGPAGSGKSMLAQRLPTILPTLSPAELLEVSMIASVAGEIKGGALTNKRPFRAPHHSASMAALVGGGLRARPGEASLAHNGVLFLDELPEFQPGVLDALRQPLEIGEVPPGCQLVEGRFWSREIARHDRRRLGYALWMVLADRLLT